ncbi:MAG: hypothetical protein ACFHXK_09345 [bacterium]
MMMYLSALKPVRMHHWVSVTIAPLIFIAAETQLPIFGSVLAVLFVGVSLGASLSAFKRYPAVNFLPNFARTMSQLVVFVIGTLTAIATCVVFNQPHFGAAEVGLMFGAGLAGFLLGAGQTAALPIVLLIIVSAFLPASDSHVVVSVPLVALADLGLLVWMYRWVSSGSNASFKPPEPTPRGQGATMRHTVSQTARVNHVLGESWVVRIATLGIFVLASPLVVAAMHYISPPTTWLVYLTFTLFCVVGVVVVAVDRSAHYARHLDMLWGFGVGADRLHLRGWLSRRVLIHLLILQGCQTLVMGWFALRYAAPLLPMTTGLLALGVLGVILVQLHFWLSVEKKVDPSSTSAALMGVGIVLGAVIAHLSFSAVSLLWVYGLCIALIGLAAHAGGLTNPYSNRSLTKL